MADTQRAIKLIKPRRDGQITIPVAFRKALGFDEDDTMIQATLTEGELHLRPVRTGNDAAGSPWLRELYDYFAPVRDGIEQQGLTEEEVNSAIDAALVAARRERHARRG